METIYSRFEIKKSKIKVANDTKVYSLNCVGKLDTELNMKTITKSCAGVVKKKRNRGAGDGTATLSLHIPYELYRKIYGMDVEGLIDGVSAYGSASVHKEFSFTGVVLDEDGVELLIALPICMASSGPKQSIENGAEEVVEVEIEMDLMPDEFDFCEYEIPSAELPESITEEKWLTEFTPSMLQAPKA